jgi:hypothetical protein
VLTPALIKVYCVLVFGQHTVQNWPATWHGIQDVALQFIKLQFYRFYVLPRAAAHLLSDKPPRNSGGDHQPQLLESPRRSLTIRYTVRERACIENLTRSGFEGIRCTC